MYICIMTECASLRTQNMLNNSIFVSNCYWMFHNVSGVNNHGVRWMYFVRFKNTVLFGLIPVLYHRTIAYFCPVFNDWRGGYTWIQLLLWYIVTSIFEFLNWLGVMYSAPCFNFCFWYHVVLKWWNYFRFILPCTDPPLVIVR